MIVTESKSINEKDQKKSPIYKHLESLTDHEGKGENTKDMREEDDEAIDTKNDNRKNKLTPKILKI